MTIHIALMPSAREFRIADGRRAVQLELEDDLGNPAWAIVVYNPPPPPPLACGGDRATEVFATEAWVLEALASTDLHDRIDSLVDFEPEC